MKLMMEGIIGSGKSFFGPIIAKKIEEEFKEECIFFPELVRDEFLGDLYRDIGDFPIKPSLVTTTFQFRALLDRFKLEKACDANKNRCVVDRSLFFDLAFVKLLRRNGFILTRDYETYIDFRYTLISQINYEEQWIIVFLDFPVNTCLSQIEQRNRTYETNITEDYLSALRNEYVQIMLHMANVIVIRNQKHAVDEIMEQYREICSSK